MTLERFIEIMNDEELEGSKLPQLMKCNALEGLKIIEKYCPHSGITGAEHDVIYSVCGDQIVDCGITEDDAKELRMLNWFVDDDYYLACYV